MLRLVSLEIEGFRSFKNKVIITFPESGAVLISGQYKSSSLKSSGSGKSSVLMAIAFALGICRLPSTELKHWHSKNINVTLVLSDGNTTYVIRRTPKLSIEINGVLVPGLANDLEEKLSQILGTKGDMLETLIFRPQKTSGKFLTSTDSEKKEFLASLLGINEIEAVVDNFDKKINILENNIKSYKSTLETVKDFAIKPVSEQELNNAKTNLENAENNLKHYKMQENNNEIKVLQEEIKKLQSIINQGISAESQNETLKQNCILLKKEIELASQCLCPTCLRPWDKSNDLIEKYKLQLKNCLDQINTNNSLISSANLAKQALVQVQEKVGDIKIQSAKLDAEYHALQLAYNTAKQKYLEMQQAAQQYQQYQNKLETIKQNLQSEQKNLDIFLCAKSILGRSGFLGEIFDEILLSIECKINEMISEIPNISDYFVQLSSTYNTKSGVNKKSISLSLYKNGIAVSPKALSGGQLSSLELCTDLAVREVIYNRSKVKLGWIALDEAFDGLDIENKQAILNVIKNKVNGLIIIVDHTTEVKENFEKVINIVYDGMTSEIIGCNL